MSLRAYRARAGAERTKRPVGLLLSLGEVDAELLGDQCGVAVARGAGEPRRDHGVEDPGRGPEAETVQHPQVEVGAVHHQLGSRQHIEQRSQIEVGQRIDQFVGVGQAHLYEAHLLVVAVQAVGLRVHADAVRRGDT